MQISVLYSHHTLIHVKMVQHDLMANSGSSMNLIGRRRPGPTCSEGKRAVHSVRSWPTLRQKYVSSEL